MGEKKVTSENAFGEGGKKFMVRMMMGCSNQCIKGYQSMPID